MVEAVCEPEQAIVVGLEDGGRVAMRGISVSRVVAPVAAVETMPAGKVEIFVTETSLPPASQKRDGLEATLDDVVAAQVSTLTMPVITYVAGLGVVTGGRLRIGATGITQHAASRVEGNTITGLVPMAFSSDGAAAACLFSGTLAKPTG